MIAKSQNIALLVIGNLAQENSDWVEYANYCFYREKGLRKDAFNYLNAFLKKTENWDLNKKIDFLNFLFPFFEKVEDADYAGFPQPLSNNMIKPTLEKWCEKETHNGNPFRWYGTYYGSEKHLFKALEINPFDDLARQKIIQKWKYNIYYSVHHLPEGYIGYPDEDIQLGEKIKSQIKQLTNSELQDYWTNYLEEDLELVRNYIEWKKSGHPDLEKWGEKNNKRVCYGGISRAYYY
ncbi:MAG: hypothetical protein LBV75_09175 [Paludibacter sp.]|jgi:hypothetical protein|nr:hypothetical protein [Paludibacter sp.]